MSIDQRELRNCLGSFATGVCVVSTAVEGEQPIAMTVNSFAAVSLQPPLVLWSLQNDSDCYRAFEKSQRFCINILAKQQLDLSVLYASRGKHQMQPEHYRIGKTGSPVLRGALCSFECRVWARYPGGDHTILVGEVLQLSRRPHGRPLLFHGGCYEEIR